MKKLIAFFYLIFAATFAVALHSSQLSAHKNFIIALPKNCPILQIFCKSKSDDAVRIVKVNQFNRLHNGQYYCVPTGFIDWRSFMIYATDQFCNVKIGRAYCGVEGCHFAGYSYQ